jgi:hypothetical protein
MPNSCDETARDSRTGDSDSQSGTYRQRPCRVADGPRHNLSRLCAERQPQPDLGGALGHGVGDDSVHADHREQKRDPCKKAEQECWKRRSAWPSARVSSSVSTPVSGKFAVDRPDRLLESLTHRGGIAGGLDGKP